MERLMAPATCVALALVATLAQAAAQAPLPAGDVIRARDAVARAFEFLYRLPRDTSAAAMGTWVLDTNATTTPAGSVDQWRIVATRLTDTGDALKVEEMTGKAGAAPTELAAAMAEMQRLEAKISKAEADASLEVAVSINDRETSINLSPSAAVEDHVVPEAGVSRLTRGHWTRVDDRDLEITVDRWVPARLYVRFAAKSTGEVRSVVVTAQGNEEMIERVLKEARWKVLAALVN